MSLAYFGGKSWRDISREERLFCAEFYQEVRGKERDFVRWLNETAEFKHEFDTSENWYIEYEVNLYRDLLYSVGSRVRESEFPNKRTFDLCLFSASEIVIIEAKAQGGFGSSQLEDLYADRKRVIHAIRAAGFETDGLRVTLLGLVSSRYRDNMENERLRGSMPTKIDGYFTWSDLNDFSTNRLFQRADDVYRN